MFAPRGDEAAGPAPTDYALHQTPVFPKRRAFTKFHGVFGFCHDRGMASTRTTPRDYLKNHALWGTLDELDTAIGSKSALSSDDRETLARLKTLGAAVKTYRNADVYLLPSNWEGTADLLTNSANEMIRQLEGWSDDAAMPTPTVAALRSNADAMLDYLMRWPLQRNSSGRRSEEEQGILDDADAELQALRAKLGGLQTEIAESSARFDGLQADVSAGARELTRLAAETETRLDVLAAKSDAAIQAVQATGTHQIADSLAETDAKTRALLEQIDDRAQQAKTLTTLIGGAGVADGYTKYADKQNTAAFRWSLAAVLLGGAAVIYIAVVLWDLKNTKDVSPAIVILRSAVSLAGLSVAGYMTRLAAHHRKQAVKARFRALDMLALGPFTDDLTLPQKQALKFQIGVASFGQDVSLDDKEALLEQFRPNPSAPTL